jgi:hypothetical protein
MTRTFIDHITVTAPSLDVGQRFVYETLGVSAQAGGEHPAMGTHNLLLKLGDTMFLEVIAANPIDPAPQRPRWFGLDRLTPQSLPSLAGWVVRTSDIQATTLKAAESLGAVEPVSRGALSWLITIPRDGSLPLNGAGPAVIEWQADIHPAVRLEDKGVSLDRLEIAHPDPDRVLRLLSSLALDRQGFEVCVVRHASTKLTAHIKTPQGSRRLSIAPPDFGFSQ